MNTVTLNSRDFINIMHGFCYHNNERKIQRILHFMTKYNVEKAWIKSVYTDNYLSIYKEYIDLYKISENNSHQFESVEISFNDYIFIKNVSSGKISITERIYDIITKSGSNMFVNIIHGSQNIKKFPSLYELKRYLGE